MTLAHTAIACCGTGRNSASPKYDPVGEHAVLIKHTEIKPEFEGKGYGSELVRRMLEDVRQQGKTVIPICPYALNFIRRHPEYIELVQPDMRSAI